MGYEEQGDMFDRAMKRPETYGFMSERDQWEVDKRLGILDWDGSCPHMNSLMCPECFRKYMNRRKDGI